MYQERVREIYNELSPAYRRIADYLLQFYRDAAFMTAAQIARTVRIDTTSVVRFAQRLGYAGFPELSADLQAAVKRDLQSIYELPAEDNTSAGVFLRSLVEDRNNLDYLLLHHDPAQVEAVASILSSARRIMIVGEAQTSHLAALFAERLTSLGFNAWAMGGDMVSRMSLSIGLTSQDAIIGIGPTGGASGISVVLKLAREAGVHTIAIVGTPVNRASLIAEHVLYAPSRTAGLLYSSSAIASMIQALSQALALRHSERTADLVVRADHFLKRFVEAMREEPQVTMREIVSDLNVPRNDE